MNKSEDSTFDKHAREEVYSLVRIRLRTAIVNGAPNRGLLEDAEAEIVRLERELVDAAEELRAVLLAPRRAPLSAASSVDQQYAASLADAVENCRVTCKHEPSAFDLEQQGYDTIIRALRLFARSSASTSEAEGTFKCPHCGGDKPHEHIIDKAGNVRAAPDPDVRCDDLTARSQAVRYQLFQKYHAYGSRERWDAHEVLLEFERTIPESHASSNVLIPADRLPRLIELVSKACRTAATDNDERSYELWTAVRRELQDAQESASATRTSDE